MPVTKEDALNCKSFHEEHAITGKINEWRRNGACQTWKTRPDDFRLPVKYGLRTYSYITPSNADMFHRADQCPTHHVRVVEDGKTWFGIILAEDNGMTAVHVTTRGQSKYRVGSQQFVPTKCVERI